MECEADQRMSMLVAEEIGPLTRIGRLSANDEDSPRVAGTIPNLLAKPFELVLTPRRFQIALRHYDDQHAGSADLRAQFRSQMRRGIDLVIHIET